MLLANWKPLSVPSTEKSFHVNPDEASTLNKRMLGELSDIWWGLWNLRALITLLLISYAGKLFGAPPPSSEMVAWAGQLHWPLVLCSLDWQSPYDRIRT